MDLLKVDTKDPLVYIKEKKTFLNQTAKLIGSDPVIMDKNDLKSAIKNLKVLKKEYTEVKKIFSDQAKNIRNHAKHEVELLHVEFIKSTTKILERITSHDAIIKKFKEEQANLIGTFNTLNNAVNGGTQQSIGDTDSTEEDPKLDNVAILSDTDIINFICDITKSTGINLVAKANDYKGVMIYQDSSSPYSDPRIALSAMIHSYNESRI